LAQAADRAIGASRDGLLLRLGAGAVLAGLAGLFATALMVEPSPSGLGTHRRLGLPPCSLYALTGVPCPTCGVTTSLAHMARLNVLEALRTQPMGAVVFTAMLLSAAFCGATIVSGRGPMIWLQSRRANWRFWTLVIVGMAAASWVCKIIVMLG